MYVHHLQVDIDMSLGRETNEFIKYKHTLQVLSLPSISCPGSFREVGRCAHRDLSASAPPARSKTHLWFSDIHPRRSDCCPRWSISRERTGGAGAVAVSFCSSIRPSSIWTRCRHSGRGSSRGVRNRHLHIPFTKSSPFVLES